MSFKAGSIPYTVVGTPDENSGTRLMPAGELIKMLNNNPGLQAAVNRVEKHDFKGKPTAIKQVVRKQLAMDYDTKVRVNNAKMAIDLAQQKKEGKGIYAK